MTTYKRIILLLCAILGLLGFLLMVSFKGLDACEYANTSIDFVKTQTQTALQAKDLNMVKLFSNKALNTMAKTKTNFIDCGCVSATETIDHIEKNLTLVSRSKNLKESKTFLKAALQSTLLSIALLREYEEEKDSFYGDDVLVMNTRSAIDEQGGIITPRGKVHEEKIRKSLVEFRESLANVIKYVECTEAFSFISKIHRKAKNDLEDPALSDNEKFYHEQIRDISYQALLQLDGCPVD